MHKLFLSIVLILFSINLMMAQTQTTIKGEVKNNKQNFTQVQLKLGYGSNLATLASANIDADGRFTLTYAQQDPDIYQLIFGNNRNNKLVVCLTPGDNIELIIDGTNTQHLLGSRGSRNVILYKQLYDCVHNTQHIMDSLNEALQNEPDREFYEKFMQRFSLYHQTNQDIDEYLIGAFMKTDSLKQYVQSKAQGGTVNKKEADEFLTTAIKTLKNIQSDYLPFENYQENVAQYYDFKSNRAKGHADLYRDVDAYQSHLDKRHAVAQKAFGPFMAQAKRITDKRDSLYFENQLSNKKEKTELCNDIIRLMNKTDLSAEQKEYTELADQADKQYKTLDNNAQKHMSQIVSKYQTIYNQKESENNNRIMNILSNNKDELVTLLFVDRFPREKNIKLHNDIAKALHERYPKQRVATERYNLSQSPAGKIAIGAEAPDMAFANPDGKIKKLSDLRGNVVLIDFWASWCRPCRMENPNVVRLYNKYHKKGFEIYSVSLDRDKNSWKKAIADDNLSWENHVSDLGYWNSAGAKLYGVSSIPCTFLLDRDGKILAKNLRGEALHEALKKIFGY